MAEEVKCKYEVDGVNTWIKDYITVYVAYRLAEHKCYEHEDKIACKHSEDFRKEAETKAEILADGLMELVKCLERK